MTSQPTGVGRQWAEQLLSQIKADYSLPQLKHRPAFENRNGVLVCQRCQQVATAQLPDGRHYCRQCLVFGRLVEGDQLFYVPAQAVTLNGAKTAKLTWTGQLTDLQTEAAQQICDVIQTQQTHVLTAVTGAGKTEMLFPGIALAMQNGQRVCIAAPRIDVCLELYPRIQAAFEHQTIMLLYGGQTAPYQDAALVICTTHQLLNFYQAFDVLIVDEVDAFPFQDNPVLAAGVKQAVRLQSALIYLTATPTKAIQQAVQTGAMTTSELPLRYHGYLLPEPNCRPLRGWQQQLSRQRLPKRFLQDCRRCLAQQRLLIFVPRVADLQPVQQVLTAWLPDVALLTVHAQDPDRLAKVAAFRAESVQVLITTTIMERGVTFQNVGVLVLGADHRIFKTATLVQIAGRAGRQKAHPDNPVYFYYQDYTLAIQRACRQIRHQNQKGRRLQCGV